VSGLAGTAVRITPRHCRIANANTLFGKPQEYAVHGMWFASPSVPVGFGERCNLSERAGLQTTSMSAMIWLREFVMKNHENIPRGLAPIPTPYEERATAWAGAMPLKHVLSCKPMRDKVTRGSMAECG